MNVAESGEAYFLDTNALVKLYHQELGSEVVEAWAATPSSYITPDELNNLTEGEPLALLTP
jgi:hypothetical protein